MHSALHDSPVTIEPNNFKYKSLSSWSLNLFMGCGHGCRFCYVPDTSVNKQQALLRSYGVNDPVGDWGSYVLVRPWNEREFMASLRKAEAIPLAMLNADGNRAVMLCTTTDPYQVIRNPNPEKQKMLNAHARSLVRRSLLAIRDHSTINVRILTRSPLAREDFDLFKSFGHRLLLGTSLPTLDPVLSKLYEPKVPAPKQRLKLLTDAHETGIPTFVAVAPVFPEVGHGGMLEVFNAVKAAAPWTVFMEPVNLRLGVAGRIRAEATRLGRDIDMTPYTDTDAWARYAIGALQDAESAAREAGIIDRLHLWPDHDALGSKRIIRLQPDGEAYLSWLGSCWDRISEWPPYTDGPNTTTVSYLTNSPIRTAAPGPFPAETSKVPNILTTEVCPTAGSPATVARNER